MGNETTAKISSTDSSRRESVGHTGSRVVQLGTRANQQGGLSHEVRERRTSEQQDHDVEMEPDLRGESEPENSEVSREAQSQDHQLHDVVEESDMELDLLAESESDSDDQSNEVASSNIQRNVQALGSDIGGVTNNLAMFSDDDSDDSTQQEDEDEEDESDGNDSDEREVTSGTLQQSVAATGSTVGGTGGSTSTVVDEFSIGSEEQAFERRSANPPTTQRTNLAPVSMQWVCFISD